MAQGHPVGGRPGLRMAFTTAIPRLSRGLGSLRARSMRLAPALAFVLLIVLWLLGLNRLAG